MDCLELCKLNLDSVILGIAKKHLPQLNLIPTVPGIKSFSAISIIAEIVVDMSVFPISKQLRSWAGLTPQNNESAGKKKTTRINRAGAYIKPLRVQCALATIKSKSYIEIRNRYLALKKSRGHKEAIIAIAIALLTAIYNILKKNKPYNPDLYHKSDFPPQHRTVSVDEAILLFKDKVILSLHLLSISVKALFFDYLFVECFTIPVFSVSIYRFFQTYSPF